MHSAGNRTPTAGHLRAPNFEQLEDRCLLNGVPPFGSPPHFETPLEDHYFLPTRSLTIGVDGQDDDPGDHVTVLAFSDNPNLVISIPAGDKFARLHFCETDYNPIGEVVVELFVTAGGAATQRFITLSTNHVDAQGNLDPNGTPFYTDVAVHRVIPSFMIQTGDAVKGNGTGGSPLGVFPDAIDPVLSFSGIGVLAMANSGPDTNDCQFFITDGRATWLDGKHMIFGQVISGQEMVRQIANFDRDANDRPYNIPLLQGVEVFDSYQDGTIIIQAVNGFVGDANVTVTLTDSEGNVTTRQVVVTVEGDLHVAPGSTTTYDVNLAGIVNPTISSSFSGATVWLDTNAGTATVAVPAEFRGMFKVSISDNSTSTPQVVRSNCVFCLDEFDALVFDRVAPPSQSGVRCTRQVGNRLYVGREPTSAYGVGGLDIYDVSDRRYPLLLGRFEKQFQFLDADDIVTQYGFRDIEAKGDTLFVGAVLGIWRLGEYRVENAIVALDASDPTSVEVLGAKPVTKVSDVCLDGNLALVAGEAEGVFAFDITDPANMIPLGAIIDLLPTLKITHAAGVVAGNGFAYVNAKLQQGSASGTGIVVLDTTNKNAIKFASFFQAGSPWGIDLQGTTLYVADYRGALAIFDVSRPLAAKFVSYIPVSGNPWQVEVDGSLAAVATNDGYAFFNVGNPKKILAYSTFVSSLSAGMHISVSGPTVALSLASDGWVMLDNIYTRIRDKRTLLDENGTAVTFNVKGGEIILTTSGFGSGRIEAMDVIGCNSTTCVTISSMAETMLGDINVHGSLGKFTAKRANLAGDMTVEGTIAGLALGDIAGGRRIDLNTLGAAIDPKLSLSVKLGQVADCLIDAHGIPVKSISAARWQNTDGNALNDKIVAPWLGKLSVSHDFAASLDLDCTTGLSALGNASIGGDVTGALWDIAGGSLDKLSVKGDMAANLKLTFAGPRPALGKASIGGNLAGRTWEIAGAVGKVTVTGKVTGSRISATGDIASLTMGAVYDSDVLAGFDSAFTDRHATDHDDFTGRPQAVIGSISIKGLKLAKGVQRPRFYVDNANFTSSKAGKVSLINTDFTDCGFYVCQSLAGGEVSRVKHTDTVLKTTWTWPGKGLQSDPGGYVHLL